MNRNAMLTSISFPSIQEDFFQEDDNSSEIEEKRSDILFTLITKRMGQSC